MALEIERKFLLKNDKWRKDVIVSKEITQAYIKGNGLAWTRIRLIGDTAYITLKGNKTNISRLEFEYEIPVEDGNQMIVNFCDKDSLRKIRHYVSHKGHTWEIDEYLDDNEGLFTAEVELECEEEHIEIPKWLGKEVTGKSKYSNSTLIKKPYNTWK